MISFLIAQICLVMFNFANAQLDAYLILQNKTISHGINFISYLTYAVLVGIGFHFSINFWLHFIPHGEFVLFLFTAFFNRQLSFDIPLNIRRGLVWYYQSADNPPKALMDRIERYVFGYTPDGKVGKAIAFFYLTMWGILINVDIWFIH